MTGRERIEAAFYSEGTEQTAAVVPYEDICFRDHWEQVTSCPWWYQVSPHIDHQLCWRHQALAATGQDWFRVHPGYSQQRRGELRVDDRPDGVFMVDLRTGDEKRLERPPVGGSFLRVGAGSAEASHLPRSPEDLDAIIPASPERGVATAARSGRLDLAAAEVRQLGSELFPIAHVGSPLWTCFMRVGYETVMTLLADRPDLVHHACERLLTRAVQHIRETADAGVAGIWIEECLTDMISPQAYETVNLPYLGRLVTEIREAGMVSIYYFCGDPARRWELLLSAGADALALEEGKKGFAIDIEQVMEYVRGRCVVLGNLDAIGVLQDGSEDELRAEIDRQMKAGRRNGGRFIMSLGSPVTPTTPLERVRLYCEMVRQAGGG